MKQFTKEEKALIEQMAELFYSPGEIAINLEVDADEFSILIKAGGNEVHTAFYQGWFKGDMALRLSISKSSANGSSPAQTMLKQLQDKAKSKFYE